jgi:hypothetical protein
MSIEGRQDTPRLDYIFDTYVAPATAPLGQLLDVLAARGEIRPIPVRELFFLLAHGAAAPFTLVPFARRFDAGDPLDHVDAVTDLLIAGLRIS